MMRMAEDPDKITRDNAGQKDVDAVHDLELKDGEDPELPWVTKVAGEDDRVTAAAT